MEQISDEDIARQVQAGQSERFGELVERYQAKLLRYARKFLLEPDDAKDIVQEIFIKTYENIQQFDTTRRFSPWVYRIAHNEFVNALKRRQSRGTVFNFDIDTLFPHLVAPETSDSGTLSRDLRQTLDHHLESLSPKYREPLILYYLEGMDYKEVSEVLQIPVSTVGVRLARGRAILKKASEGSGDDLKNLYE